jgi:hypothetical protein
MKHDRFDMLLAAVALGEASRAERAEFADHAVACDACRAEAGNASTVLNAIVDARDAETWRPAVDRAVLARIRDSRSSRFRVTIGALGWAVALSIVLNVAFVSGLSARFFGGFDASGEVADHPTAMKFSLESPEPHAPRAVLERRARVAIVPRRERRPHVHARGSGSIARRAPATPIAPDVTATDVPDVLAGLDIDGADDQAKHVAVQPARRCDDAQSEPGSDETSATAPCPVRSAADLPR